MEKPFKTGFLIFPGFPMACLTSMIEPLRAANEISEKNAFEWVLLGESSSKVPSSAGIDFEPAQTLQAVRGLDLLILLSAPTADFVQPSSAGRIRSLHRHGTTIGAVSGGVFPLVRTGVAEGRALAVHWCYKAAFANEFSQHASSDRVIEITPAIVSAAGAAAAFDLSLHLIETRLNAGVATEVACWFQHPVMRREGVGQAVPALGHDASEADLPPLVSRAVQLFAHHLSNPLSVSEIAAQLGISPRHLDRTFKQATGVNPTQYYRKMRMNAARQMIRYSSDRIADVAAQVGYGSAQVFAKHYQSAFGTSPKEDRARINLFRVTGNRPVPSI